MANPTTDRLGVCSWSLKPKNLADLIGGMKRTGINKVQLALAPLVQDPPAWENAGARFREAGIQIVSGMFGCVGEDYSTLESIRRTGGVVPDATWPGTWANVQKVFPVAAALGLKLVTFHAGFIPPDPNDPTYPKLLERIPRIADLFATQGIDLALETGQEEARTLQRFLGEMMRMSVGVNFDPANMILYGKGDPIESLRILGPHLKQCHIKDARRTATPGTWGKEVAVGEGEVDWAGFIAAWKAAGSIGHLVIEREAGDTREADIIRTREMIGKLL